MLEGFLFLIFLSTLFLTGVVKKYILAKKIIDIPNNRSSHVTPTPRGGGVAFVLIFLVSACLLFYYQLVNLHGGYVVLIAAFFIALMGYFDDLNSLSPLQRFIMQIIFAIISLYVMNFLPVINIYSYSIHPGFVLNFLVIFYLVWLTNLYNFMDGVDGIASIEAISTGLGISIIYWLTGHYDMILLPMLLSIVVAGFLYWNFPPARIFMGDVGSGFLGFMLGILSIQSLFIGVEFFYCWLILLGVFIVDSTYTLLYRMVSGKKIYLAHASHAYQHAARHYNSHLFVSMGVFFINVIWLLPICIAVSLKFIDGFLGLFIAYLPIFILSKHFNAGKT